MPRLAAALALACAAELLHFFAPDTATWRAAGMAVAAVAIELAGTSVFRKGLRALLGGRLNINALMTVAVTGAFLIGQWPEAAMVMALYSLAELIEARAVQRARNAIASLLALARAGRGGAARRRLGAMPARAVPVGARVRVKPGERLALDGRVLRGQSAVDQAPVTGESLPVDKGYPGDEVFAGTINHGGALEFEVTRPAGDTVLARIITAVEDAQAQRAPTQRFVDRFAAVYTPAVFALALAVALGGPLLLGWPWLPAVQGTGAAGHRLPVRAGHLHARHRGQRAGGGGAARHPDQGRRLPGAGAAAEDHRARQDRHPHARRASCWWTAPCCTAPMPGTRRASRAGWQRARTTRCPRPSPPG